MDNLIPIGWIDQLFSTVKETESRLAGRPVPLAEALEEVGRLLAEARGRDNAVWWVGNGGSSAICSHAAQDVMSRLSIRSMAFTDASLLTCAANDFGYAEVYVHLLRKMARPGDLLVAISSSGNSDNIVNSVAFAKANRMPTVTLSGFSPDNRLRRTGSDVDFYLPSTLYGVVEVGHELLLHGLTETMVLADGDLE